MIVPVTQTQRLFETYLQFKGVSSHACADRSASFSEFGGKYHDLSRGSTWCVISASTDAIGELVSLLVCFFDQFPRLESRQPEVRVQPL